MAQVVSRQEQATEACMALIGHSTTLAVGFAALCTWEIGMGVKKTGKGRRKLGQKKRRMRARIRHRKG